MQAFNVLQAVLKSTRETMVFPLPRIYADDAAAGAVSTGPRAPAPAMGPGTTVGGGACCTILYWWRTVSAQLHGLRRLAPVSRCLFSAARAQWQQLGLLADKEMPAARVCCRPGQL